MNCTAAGTHLHTHELAHGVQQTKKKGQETKCEQRSWKLEDCRGDMIEGPIPKRLIHNKIQIYVTAGGRAAAFSHVAMSQHVLYCVARPKLDTVREVTALNVSKLVRLVPFRPFREVRVRNLVHKAGLINGTQTK